MAEQIEQITTILVTLYGIRLIRIRMRRNEA